jgi:Tol biopolymer transport system component
MQHGDLEHEPPGPRPLPDHPYVYANATDPNVSPDGSRVIFQVTRGGNLGGALLIADMVGENVERIVPFRLEVGIKADWSPDGSHIVFTENLDEEENVPASNVATVRPDGTDLVELTHQAQPNLAAVAGSYSPDGRWILFRFDNLDTGKYTPMKMHPEGSDKTRVARLGVKERRMDWGPRAT